MIKQMNHGKDDLGKRTAFVQVPQVVFPENLLCTQQCAGFAENVEGITSMARSSFPLAGL